VTIIEATTAEQLRQVRELIAEWIAILEREHGIDMEYQAVDDELTNLPGRYARPDGRIWLARDGDGDRTAVGCIALRPLEDGVCELKRMFVTPVFRGRGIGRALAVLAIDEARQMGYRLMRLDTGTFLADSRHLYETLGFSETEPYYPVPPDVMKVTVFMELPLA